MLCQSVMSNTYNKTIQMDVNRPYAYNDVTSHNAPKEFWSQNHHLKIIKIVSRHFSGGD